MFTWMIVIISLIIALLFVVIGLRLAATEKAQGTALTPFPTITGNPPAEPITAFTRPQPQQALTGVNLGCMLLFSLFWLSFSLFGAFFAVSSLIEAWQVYGVLRERGEPLEAVIVDRRIDEDSEGDSYYVTYQYTAPLPQGDRQKFGREEQVSEEEYEAMPSETRVAILYDPNDPQIARLQAGFGPPFFNLFMGCFLIPFVLIGVALLAWVGVSFRRIILLVFYGQIISGVVVDRWVESDSDSDSYCVSYRFQPPQPGGISRPVTQAEVHYKAYHKLNVGDPVQIHYLPYKPDVCRLIF